MKLISTYSTKVNGLLIACWMLVIYMTSCSSDNSNGNNSKQSESSSTPETVAVVSDKGVGPIKDLQVGETIDEALAEKGLSVYESKCAACHKFDQRYVGPPLGGVTERRKPEWIMNMILNPEEMTKQDPVAKQLLSEYLTQMTFQNVSEEDARALVEYFRKNDKEKS